MLGSCPSWAKLATAVYRLLRAKGGWVDRVLSIIGQAPLGGFEIPSSPLSFKQVARNPLASVVCS